MDKPTLEKVVSVMSKLGMTVFKRPFDTTLFAIRTRDNVSNKFNDYLGAMYYNDKGMLTGQIVSGTTDAGLYYRQNLMNKDGVAIIQHSKQYKGVYQLQDPAKNPSQHGHKGTKAFRQIKAMDYWRDNNKDNKLDFAGKTFTEIGQTDGHYMGTLGNNVDKWSAGCWGGVVSNMNILYTIAENQIRLGYGDTYSFAMLYEDDFKL